MTIKVNNTLKNVDSSISLDSVLDSLKVSKQGIAVAINNHVITKTIWNTTFLNENDQVTIIQATQGG